MVPVDITARIQPRRPCPGLNPYADDTGLLLHLLLHAAGNMRAHVLRLLQLEDLARLARRLPASAWDRLLGANGDPAWWALPPLLLAQRYCSAPVPGEVITALSRSTPGALRRAARRYSLTEVSWSNLHISAFPGIEWSRSIGEALRYARHRIAPDRTAREELELAGVAQPMIATLPWYQLAHHRRSLRWLRGQAPRVQAMTSVLMALDGDTHASQSARSPVSSR